MSGHRSRPQSASSLGNDHETLLDSFDRLLSQRQTARQRACREELDAALASPEKFRAWQRRKRAQVRRMLPTPARMTSVALPRFAALGDATLTKLRFAVTGPYRSYAIVVRRGDARAKQPLLVIKHGRIGTPEKVLGMEGPSNYRDIAAQALDRGWTIVLPQLPIWKHAFTPPLDQLALNSALVQVGGSRAALDFLTVVRAAECAAEIHAVGKWSIAGLSYGGFCALLAGALDTRFRAVVSSCYVNDRVRYNRSDWVWQDSLAVLEDVVLAALIAPRPLVVELGTRDEVSGIESARPVLARIWKVARALDWRCVCEEFDGAHEFRPGGHSFDLIRSLAHEK